MSASVQIQGERPETIHNAREVLAIFILFAMASWFLGICAVLLVMSSLMKWKASPFWSVLGAAEWGLAAASLFYVGRFFWQRGVPPWNNRVTIDAEALNFHYRQDGAVSDFKMLRSSVGHVTHKRVANTEVYKVHGNDGGYFTFTSLTYLRPKRIADRIAEICGKPIQEES
jgi:hypothetical protein